MSEVETPDVDRPTSELVDEVVVRQAFDIIGPALDRIGR